MEKQSKTSGVAKDFFINLGATISLGVMVGYVLDLLFTVINKAYPITNSYGYYNYSISWSVSTLIVVFPIYLLLMWLLEKEYAKEPEKRFIGIKKWLTYITLFVAGFAIAGDLVTVLYKFIDGQEMTTGFIMKILSVLVISLAVFFYYISSAMGKLNSMSQKVWAGVSVVIIIGSIILGFSILGSPRTQQLFRYDEQKVNNLQSLDSRIKSYVQSKKSLPEKWSDIDSDYGYNYTDSQTGKSYEYEKINDTTYNLCASFNKDSTNLYNINKPIMYTGNIWSHPAGRHCFKMLINLKDPYDPYSNNDGAVRAVSEPILY